MPVLRNARWERFAQELAKGKTADEAYVIAGYKENRCNASRLKTTDNILHRIRELQAVAVASTEITLESLLREAADIQRLAIEDKQYAAANGALKTKSVLSGNWVEKTDNLNRNVDINRLSDEVLAEIILAERGARDRAKANGQKQLN